MKILKPVLWIVIGVIAGAASTGSARTIQTQKAAQLKWTSSTASVEGEFGSTTRFLHDPVSKGCWLFLSNASGTQMLAPAPESACYLSR